MANHKSAAKRARQNVKRNARNRSYLSSVRTAIKQYEKALTGEGKADNLTQLLSLAQSKLAKAASKGIIHSNMAKRKISRLATKLKGNA